MKKYRWLTTQEVMTINVNQIHEHGGKHGVRDLSLLQECIEKPEKLLLSDPKSNLYDLATAYVYHFIKDQPFVDGNKQTAIVAAGIFLILNGYFLETSEVEIVKYVLELSIGKCDCKTFSAWLKKNTIPLSS